MDEMLIGSSSSRSRHYGQVKDKALPTAMAKAMRARVAFLGQATPRIVDRTSVVTAARPRCQNRVSCAGAYGKPRLQPVC